MRNKIWTLIKILATLAIIAFLFSRIDLGRMAQSIARANPWLLLLALALYFLAIFLGAVKWAVLVRTQDMSASVGKLFTYSLVGLFFGNLLPSNVGGDVVRAYGLVRATARAEAAAISVLVDRLMGLTAFLGAAVVMATLAAVVLARGAETESPRGMDQVEIATIAASAIFIFASALLFSNRVAQQFKWVFDLKPLAPVRPIAQKVFSALQVYRRSYRALALNLGLSTLIVIVTTLVWYSVALALDPTQTPPLFYFFLFNPLIAFVLLIPISFNGLGPKEATAVFFFGLAHMPSEQALAMSLIFHLIIVLTSLPGGILWWRERALAPPREAATGME